MKKRAMRPLGCFVGSCAVLTVCLFSAPAGAEVDCANNTITAYVVALDQAISYNRLGANLPNGKMFALAGDVFPHGTTPDNETWANSCRNVTCTNGAVQLRSTKRPRPLVLRVNEAQCLQVIFTNLLANSGGATNTDYASVHIQGMEWLNDSNDDGSYVGNNPDSLAAPGATKTYHLFPSHEGDWVLYSMGDAWSAKVIEGSQLAFGLFGALNVQPEGAEYYRSQLTEQDLCWASTDKQGTYPGLCTRTGSGPPQIDYRAVYPPGHPQAGLPILNMVNCAGQATQGCPAGGELVHSDLNAVITGRNPATGEPGAFPPTDSSPVFNPAYSLPDRHLPYREFTIIYHEVMGMTQAFPEVYSKILNGNGNGADQFAFNYGSGGIASEIVANRLGVGPEKDCTACKYEEFFLSAWVVGDPAMVVDNPSTNNCTWSDATGTYTCTEDPPTKVLYPDDPSNVYHSYIGDHTKFRVLHGGVDLHHLHHQHAHQWLHSPDTPTGDYTDSQSIGPGSAFTMEMVYNGSGNVNQTVGDSIFHCHFYPHFAMGMWSMWRVHDVLETGTELQTGANSGIPTATARALPDGEIVSGTPIPAVVPIPTLPMAPMPGEVRLTDNGTRISVCKAGGVDCVPNTQVGTPSGYDNPGYPFYIPSVAGQRPAHPPMDFAYVCSDNSLSCNPGFPGAGVPPDLSACGPGATCVPLNGGLPRHVVEGGGETSELVLSANNATSKVDLSKVVEKASAFELPEDGTLAEKIGMQTHARRYHAACRPDGTCAPCLASDSCATACAVPAPPAPGDSCFPFFTLNGLPPQQGAPYADPCINFSPAGGVPAGLRTRHYKAADIQLDVVFNKGGWHYPQQRMTSLWGDVQPTLAGTRPPEPLFFRANARDCVDYVLANLVPNVYELDDFQVRTPTDILGQHIHLVKFDVTSSDGAANGFNYEDGTFGPNEVTERIAAINKTGGIRASATPGSQQTKLTAKEIPFFGPGPAGQWVGSQATVQRWYADPLFDGGTNPPEPGAKDRTLRTVFTHDHFSPSTHQQAGLYAGLVVEPEGSTWHFNTGSGAAFGGAGQPLNGRLGTGYKGITTHDGGPTSWQAMITSGSGGADSFREFLFEIQDSTLTYEPFDHVQAPAQMAQGFCSDTFAPCTPATIHNFDQAVAPCSNPEATCFGYGFCSDSLVQKCAPESALNVACGGCDGNDNCNNNPAKSCKDSALATCSDANARCNLVPGIPGADVAAGGSPAVAFWGTTPIDAPGGPEVITLTGATFNFSVNYRNEPLFPRIQASPVALKSLTRAERQAALAVDETIDLSWAYTSIERPNLAYGWCDFAGNAPGGGTVYPCRCTDNAAACTSNADCSPQALCSPYPALTPGVLPNDPFTPLLRGYAGDDVQVRTLVGAHINPHNFTLQGLSWLMEPSMVDSGWRNNQVMGISEHFEMLFPLPPFTSTASFPGIGTTPRADYLYMGGAAAAEQSQGNWGLLRAYGATQSDLPRLPNNPTGPPQVPVCPSGGTTRFYAVVATTAQQALGGPLVYNSRLTALGSTSQVPFEDPNALLYVNQRNLQAAGGGPCDSDFKTCKLSDPSKVEPLVLRANAGDCISVTLYNAIDTAHVGPGASNPVNTTDPSNTSTEVGLHPQLVNFDVTRSNGFNVGTNSAQTVAAISGGETPTCAATTFPQAGVNCTTYEWYAGNIDPSAATLAGQHIPIELGAANLLATDVLNHYSYGLFGALVIEPAGSQWDASAGTSTQVMAANGDLLFNEFVVIFQDGLPLLNSAARPAPLLTNPSDKMNAVNYKTELLYQPYGPNRQVRSCGDPAQVSTSNTVAPQTEAVSCALSSAISPTPVAVCCTEWTSNACSKAVACGEPQTPTFTACAGEPVRFRVLHGGGVNTDQVFELAGHNWAETPYVSSGLGCLQVTTQTNLHASSVIGDDQHLCTPAALAEQKDLFDGAPPLAAFDNTMDSLSDWQGSRMGHGPGHHFDVVIDSAGGVNAVPGDYFYRSYPAMHFNLGPWGIFRVESCSP